MSSSLWPHGLKHARLPCPSPISQRLLKLMSIESMMPSNHLFSIVPFSSCLQSFPASGSFPMSRLFASGGQSIAASASTSASVLPMNIQGWFPLDLIHLISLQSKGLSRVFSNATVQRHQFFSISIFYCPAITSIHDYWKNHNLDYMNLCRQSNVSALLEATLKVCFWFFSCFCMKSQKPTSYVAYWRSLLLEAPRLIILTSQCLLYFKSVSDLLPWI